MGRMSARFVGNKLGMPTKRVYEIWSAMGIVVKDKFGDWVVSPTGREIGGRMSQGSRLAVPTFDLDVVAEHMKDFCNKHTK